ncbi:MAG: hypothetical protein MJZ62_01300 [Bacteroidales bacterium]|nr:hypothetical protein [Bacteroidales bacterium]
MDFGDILWIGFLLFSVFGGSIVKMFRRQNESESAPQQGSSVSNSNYEEEYDEDAYEENFHKESFEGNLEASLKEEVAAPYFSYEDEAVQEEMARMEALRQEALRQEALLRELRQREAERQEAQRRASESKRRSQQAASVEAQDNSNEEVLEESFDLRRAIIYQTILENKYITDLR